VLSAAKVGPRLVELTLEHRDLLAERARSKGCPISQAKLHLGAIGFILLLSCSALGTSRVRVFASLHMPGTAVVSAPCSEGARARMRTHRGLDELGLRARGVGLPLLLIQPLRVALQLPNQLHALASSGGGRGVMRRTRLTMPAVVWKRARIAVFSEDKRAFCAAHLSDPQRASAMTNGAHLRLERVDGHGRQPDLQRGRVAVQSRNAHNVRQLHARMCPAVRHAHAGEDGSRTRRGDTAARVLTLGSFTRAPSVRSSADALRRDSAPA
jgi:hypothetical protein